MSDCTVTINGEDAEVKRLDVYSIKGGKTFVEVSSLSQLADLLGGEDKSITVDGEPLSEVQGRPVTGEEKVVVSTAKGAQG